MEISRWNLQNDLMKLGSREYRPSTIKRKVKLILEKYDSIILGNEDIREHYFRIEKALKVLNSGIITYYTPEKECKLSVKDIRVIEKFKDQVIIKLHSGEEITFGSGNDYLFEIL